MTIRRTWKSPDGTGLWASSRTFPGITVRDSDFKNGDTLKASIIGNVITVLVNGVQKAQVTDNTFKTGNPGIGRNSGLQQGQGVGTNSDFGFASFTARAIEPGTPKSKKKESH